MSDTINIFVYGTLKPGESNYQHYCAGKVLEAKRAIAFGQLFALPFGYPAMTEGEYPVQGFLLSFSDAAILRQLDLLEDFNPYKPAHHNDYHRQTIETYNTSLVSLGLAWAYFMTPKQVYFLDGVFLPDGCWSGSGLDPESTEIDTLS